MKATIGRIPAIWPVLAVALLLRLAAGGIVEQHVATRGTSPFLIAGDAEGYWDLAHDILEGRDYAVYDPPRRIMRTPGFPALLAGILAITGDRLPFVRVGLALVGTAACAIVYAFGTRLFDRKTGLLAALIVAVSPTMTVFSVLILSETAFAATMTLAMLAAYRWHQTVANGAGWSPTATAAALAGLAHATAFYVRPSWLLAPPFLVGLTILLFPNRRGILSGLLVMGTLSLALVPWWVRNAQVADRFVPTTLWVGPSLYDGLNPEATGDSNMQFFDRDQLLSSMSEVEMDAEYRRRSREFAWTNPGRSAHLFILKSIRYWSLWPNANQFSGRFARLAVTAFNLPLLVLAGIGVWCARKRGILVLFAAGPVVYFWLIHAVFVGSLRYRLPAEYPLAVMAAVGLQALWSRWMVKDRAEDGTDAGG